MWCVCNHKFKKNNLFFQSTLLKYCVEAKGNSFYGYYKTYIIIKRFGDSTKLLTLFYLCQFCIGMKLCIWFCTNIFMKDYFFQIFQSLSNKYM